jgi:mono/diheme cytochrome c family protein
MPAFGDMLEPADIDGLTQYVLSLSGGGDPAAAAGHRQSFLDNCASCHGENGKGLREFGAPDLTDGIWLYGGDPATVRESIARARFGTMPAFRRRLRGHRQGRRLRQYPGRRRVAAAQRQPAGFGGSRRTSRFSQPRDCRRTGTSCSSIRVAIMKVLA